MRKRLALAALIAWSASAAAAQTMFPTPSGSSAAPLVVPGTLNASSQAVPLAAFGLGNAGYPPGSTPLIATFNGADTASQAITFAADTARVNFVCEVSIEGLGATATATVSPSISGLASGSTWTFFDDYIFATGAAVVNTPFRKSFNPCLAGNAVNTALSLTVPGAAGNTTTVIQMSGYKQ